MVLTQIYQKTLLINPVKYRKIQTQWELVHGHTFPLEIEISKKADA